MISRFKPAVRAIALGAQPAVCQPLVFSYGVPPVELASEPEDWRAFAAAWLREQNLEGPAAMLVAGPSPAGEKIFTNPLTTS
jgi:pyruvate kinase